jgi:uncharacterized membrane protein
MDPRQLSQQLRTDRSDDMARRRGVVALAMTAAGAMGLIALYQIGILKPIPEPSLPLLDADKVDASDEAYAHLSMGDAFIGFASYSATMALAAMGGPQRAVERPWIPVGLAVKAAFDAAQAAKLTVHQWTRHRAFCSWCLLAAGATFATLPLTLPEARAALRRRAARPESSRRARPA